MTLKLMTLGRAYAERRKNVEININTKNICSIVCKCANNELLLHTVSEKHSTGKLFNSMIISLPGLPYWQHTWGAFSILTPRLVSFIPVQRYVNIQKIRLYYELSIEMYEVKEYKSGID